MTTIAELREQKTQLIAYCTSKLKSGDYHAVQDAASDIRELDAKLELLREQSEQSSLAGLSLSSAINIATQRLRARDCNVIEGEHHE